MSYRKTSFVGLITFDASHKHAEITEYLRKRGYEKKTLIDMIFHLIPTSVQWIVMSK